jgi:hypothetical protein
MILLHTVGGVIPLGNGVGGMRLSGMRFGTTWCAGAGMCQKLPVFWRFISGKSNYYFA